MATAAIMAAQAQHAHERAVEVVAEHGRPERLENLQNISVAQARPRNPEHLNAFQAELIASLAEIIEGQARRLEEQDRRLGELEQRPVAQGAASKSKKAPKGS